MSPKLTTELASAIDAQGDSPLRAVHPLTGKVYILLSEERYTRLRSFYEDDHQSAEEQRRQLLEAGRRAQWDAPEMDAYDHYDEHRARMAT
jgi:hypothetical protein